MHAIGAGPLAILLILAWRDVRAEETELTFALASEVVMRGISVARKEPSAQAAVTYYGTAGWFVGVGAASLRSASSRAEALLVTSKLGYAWPLSDGWGTQLDYAHYAYPSSASFRSFEHDELRFGFAYRDLVVVTASAVRNAQISAGGSRFSLAYDLSGRLPMGNGLALAAGIGYQDLHRRSGFGYLYGHGGVGVWLGEIQLDVSYIMTDATAKARFGESASDRWTASLSRSF